MSKKGIEQELAGVKTRLEKLEARVASHPRQDRRTGFGALEGSTFHREAARLGAAYRARVNKRK